MQNTCSIEMRVLTLQSYLILKYTRWHSFNTPLEEGVADELQCCCGVKHSLMHAYIIIAITPIIAMFSLGRCPVYALNVEGYLSTVSSRTIIIVCRQRGRKKKKFIFAYVFGYTG